MAKKNGTQNVMIRMISSFLFQKNERWHTLANLIKPDHISRSSQPSNGATVFVQRLFRCEFLCHLPSTEEAGHTLQGLPGQAYLCCTYRKKL